ncbi:hypothetical protein [Acidaminococcus timonensis]|uniref:hypothetical protein n=1 Tax=Acidaminococcus timonensis TaxID=1871002 RepID=UPI002942F2A0|nr:hypothetical protein [Acidaminococcus timonensis]
MFKKIVLCCCLLAFLMAGCGRESNKAENIQVASYPGWVEIKAGDQASFAVPPEMVLQSQETRDELLKAPDLDPLLKVWLKADQETVQKPGCVIVQSGRLDPIPWNTDEKPVWVEFKTMASPEKLPKYGQNLGLKGNEIQDFGNITQKSLEGMYKKMLPEGYSQKFSNWKPMKSTIVNGVENLHTAFDMEVLKNGQHLITFHAERWTLFNRDRIHTLMVVWNTADDGYWSADEHRLSNIINTLKITPSNAK